MAPRTTRRRPKPIQEHVTPPPEPELGDIATALEVVAFVIERRALTGQRRRLLRIAVGVRDSAAALGEVEDGIQSAGIEVTREHIRQIEAKALRMLRRKGTAWLPERS